MQKKLKLAVVALCSSSIVVAQSNNNTDTIRHEQTQNVMDESAFTFTEAQLGEDNDRSSNVTILNSIVMCTPLKLDFYILHYASDTVR